jgi:hypothetical protein
MRLGGPERELERRGQAHDRSGRAVVGVAANEADHELGAFGVDRKARPVRVRARLVERVRVVADRRLECVVARELEKRVRVVPADLEPDRHRGRARAVGLDRDFRINPAGPDVRGFHRLGATHGRESQTTHQR